MGLRKLGDSAWIFTSGQDDARSHLDLVLLIQELLETHPCPEITDIVSSFDSIAVHFDPVHGAKVLKHLTSLPTPSSSSDGLPNAKTITIPICYDEDSASDLSDISKATGLPKEEIIRLHSSATYTVAAIGFSPGFPYLIGLPKELHLPRKSSPHPLPAGSVAIAAHQAGIYPNDSQGGWHVLGKTDIALFDPNRDEPSLLKAGDTVRFEVVNELRSQVTTRPAAIDSDGPIEVIDPGALTSVQDLGRPGYQHIGVTPGGAVDPISARVANRLVGNPDDAAVLECTMTGPVLKFHQDTRVAWVGWADQRSGTPHEIKAGDRIELSHRLLHLRGYIAVAGGIDVPQVMTSRATDVRGQFGGYHGRMLQAGDRLPIGTPGDGPAPGNCRIAWPHPEHGILEIRFLKGVQSGWFSEKAKQTFSQSLYQVSPVSDRTGTRFDGAKIVAEEGHSMTSQPVIAGSIQIPPDGQPIALMAEHQTIGGYPQIGHVISADLPKLARAWPGTRVNFQPVTIHEAREAWDDLQRELGIMKTGLQYFPTSS